MKDLIQGKYYRITKISDSDPNPTLKVGDVVLCKEMTAGCIDPEYRSDYGIGVPYFADYDGGIFNTLIESVEEID